LAHSEIMTNNAKHAKEMNGPFFRGGYRHRKSGKYVV
jgi:hypothetical protein